MFGLSFEDQLKIVVVECRKRSGLSQNDLATLAGVGRTAVQRLESGNMTIQMDTLLKILKVLNINLHFETPFGKSLGALSFLSE